MPRTPGLLTLPSSRPALEADVARLERELGHAPPGRRRRVLALERRRAVIALDRIVRAW